MPEVAGPQGIVVSLSPSELAVVLAALRLLRSTLGREEADELAEVMALIARLEADDPRASVTPG